MITALSKWYARVLDLRGVSKWTEFSGCRVCTQAGFRKGYATYDQLLILQSVLNKYAYRKRGVFHRVYVGFIDFRKAYDLVIWERLWLRLQGIGVPERVVIAIRAYYEGAAACVKTPGGVSEKFSLSRGVKQGCPLSCTLFGLFIDAIHEGLSARMAQGDLNGRVPEFQGVPVLDLLFADDTTLLALDPETLQLLLGEVERFCADWGMEVNVGKTKVMLCRKAEDQGPVPSFCLSGQEIEGVESFKYLGVMFHCSKGLAGSFEHRMALARKASFALSQKCVATGIHNPATMCSLFKAIVMPVLFHGAQVAVPFWTTSQLEEAEVLFKRFLKAALGVPVNTPDYVVYGEVGQFPISEYPVGWVVKYWNKVWSEENQSHLKYLVVRGDWEHRFHAGWRSSWVAKTMEYFVGQGVNIGSAGSRMVPNAAQQVRNLRGWFQRAWEGREVTEYSSFRRFYRQITPCWGVDRSVSVPDKKLRIVLARFRAGCYELNSGPRHGYQRMGRGANRACPCCRRGPETMAHFFFYCPAYEQERVRLGINRFWGTGTIQTSLVRLFQDRHSRPETLARFIAFAWRVRDRYLQGDDFLQLWE